MSNLKRARAYGTKFIFIMAGTNDAIEGDVDLEKMQRMWTSICSNDRVVITLAPLTRNQVLNARILAINEIVNNTCSNVPVISLLDLLDAEGLLHERFTTDGVHFNEAADQVWQSQLSVFLE